MAPYEFCGHDWQNRFVDVVRSASNDLLLCSPYISRYGCDVVLTGLSQECKDSGCVTVVTDLSPEAICQGSTDPGAIGLVGDHVRNLQVRHLPRLHAKVYVADAKMAIVTSGNLTAGGLRQNYEYGVHLFDPGAVGRIRGDVYAIADLGARVESGQLAEYSEIAREVRSSYDKARRSIAAGIRRRFLGMVRRAEDQLVRLRLAGGAMHTVFAQTILYLLRKLGPLTTVQLHSRIEALHPDLCDNSIDRVIDGKRFGKKWKHAVRTAQQQLKRNGLVNLKGDLWYAIEGIGEDTPPPGTTV